MTLDQINKEALREFDEFAKDLCIRFEPDGDGDEYNVYLSEIMGYNELKDFFSHHLSLAYEKGYKDGWKRVFLPTPKTKHAQHH